MALPTGVKKQLTEDEFIFKMKLIIKLVSAYSNLQATLIQGYTRQTKL